MARRTTATERAVKARRGVGDDALERGLAVPCAVHRAWPVLPRNASPAAPAAALNSSALRSCFGFVCLALLLVLLLPCLGLFLGFCRGCRRHDRGGVFGCFGGGAGIVDRGSCCQCKR